MLQNVSDGELPPQLLLICLEVAMWQAHSSLDQWFDTTAEDGVSEGEGDLLPTACAHAEEMFTAAVRLLAPLSAFARLVEPLLSFFRVECWLG